MAETSLVIFHIGPVQDIIATARRSRDLWFGSWLLSDLAKAAARQIEDMSPGALIFPNPSSLNSQKGSSAPNKIVAVTEIDPRELGKKVREAIVSRLTNLARDVLDRLDDQINQDLAQRQVEDLLEYFWVSVPLASVNEYSRVRDEAETLLAARKATRNFKQALGDHSPKSSLDGARESVIPELMYPKANDPNRVEKVRDLYNQYRARPGERLSGVDLLKRLGEARSAPKFKSTSHMAALPFLNKLGNPNTSELIAEIRKLFTEAGIKIEESDDGALLYESRLTDWLPAGAEQDEIHSRLDALLTSYAGQMRPNPYYALLAADGDNMGVVIDAQETIEAHRDLSLALSKFAEEAPGILQEHEGALIYAGGDDVLAYLPLHTVLQCANKLEKIFKDRLKKFKVKKNGEEISPTLSIGLVIAHHLDPLSDTLELARKAEREAKAVKGKNGLAVTLSKRSGVDRTISGKWGQLETRLAKLIHFAQTGAISAGTAYELRELDRVLGSTFPVGGITAEASRIVGRKREADGEQGISKEVQEAFERWIAPDEGSRISLEELANEMIIAQLLAGDKDLRQELRADTA